MDQTELLETLAALRAAAERVEIGEILGQHDQAISFARARLLALDPGRWRAAEREHVATCRRCRLLVQTMEREMDHPPLWTLALGRLERLVGEAAQAYRYHVEDGRCQACARRLAWWPSRVELPQLASLARFSAVGFAAAAGDGVREGAGAADQGLEVRLDARLGDAVLEFGVRTRRAELAGALVAYRLGGLDEAAGAIAGYLPLGQSDANGWLIARTRLERSAVRQAVPGAAGPDLVVLALPLSALTAVDGRALVESVRAAPADERQRWRSWLGQTLARPNLEPDAHAILSEAAQALATS